MNMIKQEQKLINLKQGDEIAFEELYHFYRERIYLSALQLVKSHELAQEILQDVFMKLWQNRMGIDLTRNFEAYLFKIMRTTSYDYFRKIALDQERMEFLIVQTNKIQTATVENDISYKEAKSHLEEILLQLPEKRREVYRMCKLEGRSHEEVSELLNVSPATINNHIVKASRFVRTHFKPEFYLILFFLLKA